MRRGKLHDPVDSEAMSGRCFSMPPRSAPWPERPPVENWTIMPGQCVSSPSFSRANLSGSDVVDWSSLRTCTCASDAPASKAACVDSTCSAIVIGTAGLCSLRGTDPVIATVMMQGFVIGPIHMLIDAMRTQAARAVTLARIRPGAQRGSSMTDLNETGATLETPERTRQRLAERLFGQPIIQNQFRSTYVEAMIEPYLTKAGWRFVGSDWNGWDFQRDEKRLEVKQSAAVQSWSFGRETLTRPSYDIATRTGYFENGGADWVSHEGRPAHVYIFAWHGVRPSAPLKMHSASPVDHRNPSQWDFHVVAERSLPDQRTISLASLIKTCSVESVQIEELARQVDTVLGKT